VGVLLRLAAQSDEPAEPVRECRQLGGAVTVLGRPPARLLRQTGRLFVLLGLLFVLLLRRRVVVLLLGRSPVHPRPTCRPDAHHCRSVYFRTLWGTEKTALDFLVPFHFVTGGIHEALDRAREAAAAAGKDVRIGGGAPPATASFRKEVLLPGGPRYRCCSCKQMTMTRIPQQWHQGDHGRDTC
jgi:hypothetical protein